MVYRGRCGVVGDGPLRQLVENATDPKIAALSWDTFAEVALEMAQAAFLIVPSMCRQPGMVTIEAFCRGLPVMGSRIGALQKIFDNGATGRYFS